MTAFFYKEVPEYRMKGFCSVRDPFDNLSNILNLAEIVNTCSHCIIKEYEDNFDLAVFSGNFTRALIKKNNSCYFSMAIPFQIISLEEGIVFNCDDIGQEVSGLFISILRNALITSKDGHFYHDEIVCSISDTFNLSIEESIRYYDSFVTILSDDHGYFRFDDDPNNAKGDFHPRFHFDFFYKNSTSIKIGYDAPFGIECFYSLLDSKYPKRYLRR